MYCRSQASASSSRNPAKQLPGSITATRLRLVTSSRLKVRLRYCVGLVHEPVVGEVAELGVVREDGGRRRPRCGAPRCRAPARWCAAAAPGRRARGRRRTGSSRRPARTGLVGGRSSVGPATVMSTRRAVAVEGRGDVRVGDRVAVLGALERGERDAGAARRRSERVGGLAGPAGDVLVPALAGDGRVDEAPLDGGRAAVALGLGGEQVGAVLADVALVDDAGQAAGARGARRAAAPRAG